MYQGPSRQRATSAAAACLVILAAALPGCHSAPSTASTPPPPGPAPRCDIHHRPQVWSPVWTFADSTGPGPNALDLDSQPATNPHPTANNALPGWAWICKSCVKAHAARTSN